MKKCIFLFFLTIHLPCMASKTAIQPLKQTVDSANNPFLLQQDLNSVALMTAQDLSQNNASNLNLTNNTGERQTVYGVYLYGVAFITPGLDCINGISPGGSNNKIEPYMTGDVTPVTFNAGQSVAIGQNYLYNMLYSWIYFYTTTPGTPGCLLPGCSWPGDTPQNWCFQLGAVAPDASNTSQFQRTKVAPYSWLVTRTLSPAYNYNLIADLSPAYIWLGPFTCDDQTLTCTTPVPQFQPFPK